MHKLNITQKDGKYLLAQWSSGLKCIVLNSYFGMWHGSIPSRGGNFYKCKGFVITQYYKELG